MNSGKKDTRWMTSVALMAAIVILLANTPLGMIQLPIINNCAYPRHSRGRASGAAGGSHSGSGVRRMLYDQQYNGADASVLCLFSLYEHDRDCGGCQGSLDICGMQDHDRSGVGMALDSA